MDKLFTAVKEGYDQKNRIVFIIKTDAGFSVTNPRTGFASKAWSTENDPELLACYERQIANSQNHASYLPAERDEVKVAKPVAAKVAKPVAAKVAEPVAAKVAKPVAAKVAEPVAAKVAKPVAAKVAEPVAAKVAKPVAGKTVNK